MTTDAANASTPSAPAGAAEAVYNCRQCQSPLYSPYHSICPVCATPIDTHEIQRVLGKRIEVATGKVASGDSNMVVVGVIIAVALAVLLLVLLNS